MPINPDNLLKRIKEEAWARSFPLEDDFLTHLMEWIEEQILSDFLDEITRQVDEIIEIDPDLPEPRILERATRHLVDSLDAHSASVRIYDPQTAQMLSYGSYPFDEEQRETYIPLDGSIAGEVLKTRLPCLVPDILLEDRYHNKNVIYRKGVHSLMAIPLEIPRFFPRERDTVGVIQIYFAERGHHFSPVAIKMANLMAKRLSFVIARRKILSMQRANEKKEAIIEHIFHAVGTRGGIKMKEIFNRVIPELADMVNLQSSALFSVSEDYESVYLEAGFPGDGGYHSIGKKIYFDGAPAFEVLLNLREYSRTTSSEVISPSYLLVVDPQRSDLLSPDLKKFAALNNINSILYVPLKDDEEVTHFMTFDAIDQRKRYSDDEIDIFVFLGRELVKAQKMERLDDTLHDFKNPAIAIAGFARRLKKLVEQGESPFSNEQIKRYADILVQETSRIQELGLSIYKVGEEQEVNLANVVQKRFEINREAIREQLKQNIVLKKGPFEPNLKVRCFPIHLERVLDNLLNNATKAIPLKGGELSIRTYSEGRWACADITNTGHVSDEDQMRLLGDEGEGRGLYITYRIIRLLKGEIEIIRGKDTTTFSVRLPLFKEQHVEP
ncbi:MAG: GAF domain-containing sensor histidine kinase [Desulfatiglans sp.]|jgi:signal transduction histidine kinase|nr:GAF domain-containing sensor histidine kinase [Thermodesulfobacteriota bacterium]MEE4352024.1 GAF domain-containing sensor histidine kinase [Desulfatiglans sp.]